MKKAALFIFLVFLISGCAALKEGARGFLGISTRALEEARPEGVVKEFNYDYFTAYAKTLDALRQPLEPSKSPSEIRDHKFYIYARGVAKHMIAGYVSETDTTPVGIFFEEVNRDTTRIVVASQSTYAKDYIAGKLFAILEKEANKKVDVKQQ